MLSERPSANEPVRVLVVDDEASLLATLAANLELEGFEVFEAASAARALAVLAAERIDLVLTDIRMPGMSGVDLFYELKRLRPAMPVVLMTAFAAHGLAERALGDGAFTVLAKPFAMEHVVATLTRAARRPVVLVVDGEDAALIARGLCAAGIRAEAVTGEVPALDALRGGRVDVCVVSLASRREDADAFFRALSAREPPIPVVAIAGPRAPGLVQRMAELRPFALVRPPVDVASLARVIAGARGAREVSAAGPAAGQP